MRRYIDDTSYPIGITHRVGIKFHITDSSIHTSVKTFLDGRVYYLLKALETRVAFPCEFLVVVIHK